MRENNGKKPSGRVNYFRVLAGGYLLYLAYKLLWNIWQEEADVPVIGVCGAVVFAIVGAWLLWQEWKAYRYAKEHVDDPDSWSDEPADAAETGDEAELTDGAEAPEETETSDETEAETEEEP